MNANNLQQDPNGIQENLEQQNLEQHWHYETWNQISKSQVKVSLQTSRSLFTSLEMTFHTSGKDFWLGIMNCVKGYQFPCVSLASLASPHRNVLHVLDNLTKTEYFYNKVSSFMLLECQWISMDFLSFRCSRSDVPGGVCRNIELK